MSVETVMRPSSNGDVIQLNPYGGGANWQCVDEAILNSGDYVYYVQQDKYDLYKFSPESSIGQTIESVSLHAVAGRDTAGSGSLYFVLKSNGVTYGYPTAHEGMALSSGGWFEGSATFTTNPTTGLAWTRAEVLALQSGPRLYSWGAHFMACAQYWIVVRHRTIPRARAQIIGLW